MPGKDELTVDKLKGNWEAAINDKIKTYTIGQNKRGGWAMFYQGGYVGPIEIFSEHQVIWFAKERWLGEVQGGGQPQEIVWKSISVGKEPRQIVFKKTV